MLERKTRYEKRGGSGSMKRVLATKPDGSTSQYFYSRLWGGGGTWYRDDDGTPYRIDRHEVPLKVRNLWGPE